MKNIYVIPTDKPSRLILQGSELVLSKYMEVNEGFSEFNQHLFITSDEEIKEGDSVHSTAQDYNMQKVSKGLEKSYNDVEHYKKIILTTDQDLIKDGVQAIDDEFLEWFVKNPKCEEVEVDKVDIEQPKPLYSNGNHKGERIWLESYKIIIPKEEREQERMYSDMQEYAEFCIRCYEKGLPCIIAKDWFEQFKKK